MNVNPYYIILTNLNTSAYKEDVRIDGWQGITERLFRGSDYGAVNLNQTLPIKFPRIGDSSTDKGGYYFISDAKNSDGVKALIKIEIKRLDYNTNKYVESFVGMLDFKPSAGYNKQDEFIECKVIDSGKFSKFSSRDEIDYNVFDLVSSDNVTIPGFTSPYVEATYKHIDIYSIVDITDGEIDKPSGASPITTPLDYDKLQVISSDIINEIKKRQLINDTPAELSDIKTKQVIYTNDTDFDTTLIFKNIIADIYHQYVFDLTNPTNRARGAFSWFINSYSSDDVIQDAYIIVEQNPTWADNITSPYFTDQTINVDITNPVNIVVPSGGYLTSTYQIGLAASALNVSLQYNINSNNIRLYYYEKTDGWPDNQIRGLYSHEILSRLVQLMTSETDTSKLVYSSITGKPDSEFQSYTGTGFLSRQFFANGAQLRQLVDRALNINFKDAFKSLNAITPIGCWYDKVNDYFVVEDIESFYLAELYSFDLGQVKDLKTTDFKELYFNTILTGFPKIDYEEFNGVNEVNTETEHEIPIEEKSKYNIRSPYYGDSKGQEFARRKNISVAASEDTKYDNNVYVTKLNSSNETIQGLSNGVTGYEGVEQDYNLDQTPRKNLKRHLKIIQAPLYKDSSDIFTFRKSTKDTNITYTDPETLDIVNELDNLAQFALSNNIIDPELDEFEGVINDDIANEIIANPHKIIPYLDREENRKYGYIWELELNRHTKKATYRLIKVNENRIP